MLWDLFGLVQIYWTKCRLTDLMQTCVTGPMCRLCGLVVVWIYWTNVDLLASWEFIEV